MSNVPRPAFDPFSRLVPAAALFLAALLYYVTAPPGGAYWWSDAPRHVLNGLFLRDLLLALPTLALWEIKSFAYDYYAQYPALTIGFYPPLFYLFEAFLFALFGASANLAQGAVAACVFLTGAGAYRVARHGLTPLAALAASLLLLAAPELLLWGRQVMLELPAFGLLLWASHLFLLFLEAERPRTFFFFLTLLLAALYVKINAGFLIPLFALMLIWKHGAGLLKKKWFWGGALYSVIGVLPLLAMLFTFGKHNFSSVGSVVAEIPTFTRGFWFYLGALPAVAGYWNVIPGGLYLIGAPWMRSQGPLWLFLMGWFFLGYLLFASLIIKEPRHILFLVFPLATGAVLLMQRLISHPWRDSVLVLLAAGTLLSSQAVHPTPRVEGYDKAADFLAERAPEGSVILFSGYRDGSFITHLRLRDPGRRLSVLRSDKLFLKVANLREMGVAERGLDAAAVRKLLREYGVRYVVNEPVYWRGVPQMETFQQVLEGPDYRKTGVIPISGNMRKTEKELVVYESVQPVGPGKQRIRLNLGLVGETIEGQAAQPRTPTGR